MKYTPEEAMAVLNEVENKVRQAMEMQHTVLRLLAINGSLGAIELLSKATIATLSSALPLNDPVIVKDI